MFNGKSAQSVSGNPRFSDPSVNISDADFLHCFDPIYAPIVLIHESVGSVPKLISICSRCLQTRCSFGIILLPTFYIVKFFILYLAGYSVNLMLNA